MSAGREPHALGEFGFFVLQEAPGRCKQVPQWGNVVLSHRDGNHVDGANVASQHAFDNGCPNREMRMNASSFLADARGPIDPADARQRSHDRIVLHLIS